MAYPFVDTAPQFLASDATLLAGGSLYFYQTETTTPKNTYSDQALTIPNANPMVLNSAGRPANAIWMTGTYSVVLKNAAGATIWTRDPYIVGDTPDQTGHSGEYLSTNGTSLSWAAAAPANALYFVKAASTALSNERVLRFPAPWFFNSDSSGVYTVSFDWSTAGNAMAGGLLADFEMKDHAETSQDVVGAATTTIDYSLGAIVNLSQAVNIGTLSFTNPPASGKSCTITIIRTKDNSATPRTITWPASVKWSGAVAPTLTATANCVDLITLITRDGGTTWYAAATLDLR